MSAYRPITDTAPAPRPPLLRQFRRAARAAIRCLDTWIERRGQRNALAELTDEQLRDIGLWRSEAFREAATPFWKP